MVSLVITEIIEIPLPQLIPMWQHALLGNYRQQEAKRYLGKISFKVCIIIQSQPSSSCSD